MATSSPDHLARLDHAHVWHPFTPMRQWRESDPLIITHGQGPYLFDAQGRRYIDGVSSLWCNVHGHRVPRIDDAVRAQLDRVAHTTLLGLASPPSIELAARLVEIAPREPGRAPLNKVFYSDAGATAVEAALKIAVGYWYHRGQPQRNRFIAFTNAYHGDTTGSMSVGYSDFFHRAFTSMVFPIHFAPIPEPPATGAAVGGRWQWPSESEEFLSEGRDRSLAMLEGLLREHGASTAGIIIEPVMQGAAGMIAQPPGFLRRVADLARQHGTLLIADEVATGFGRTGRMFACEHEQVQPDIICMAKGITGGYLPLAATMVTDEVEDAYTGDIGDRRTFFHGHTYTGNPLACAAALASLQLFHDNSLLDHVQKSAALATRRLDVLRESRVVRDVRQRGLMIGIEVCMNRTTGEPMHWEKRLGYHLCMDLRQHGILIRPLGDTLILMPILATPQDVLEELLAQVTDLLLGT